MSCPRTRETDFASFALARRAPEFAALRDHYPRCRDCGREVARWSRLLSALREEGVGVNEHPSEERLLAFQSAPDALAPAERATLEAHLADCAPCRSELRVLAGFDFGALSTAPARQPESGGWLAALGARLFGRPLAPAFALLALFALAAPAAWLGWWMVTRTPREAAAPPVARVETPAPPARPPVVAVPEREPAPVEVAREEPPSPAPTGRAPAVSPAEPPPAAPPPRPAAPDSHPEAPLQIAALLPAELPRYQPDAALAGGSLESVRVASLVRSGAQPLPALHALAPEHVAASTETSPVLYWHLSAESAVPVEISVYSEQDEAAPLAEQWLEPPVAAGLHAFRFAEQGLRLAPGVTYHWSAALVPDRENRESDAVAVALLRHAPPVAALRARLDGSPPAERAHALAAAGYWLDAFATFTDWLAAEPDAANLRAQRAALLEQVGLAAVAAQLDAPGS